MAKQRSDLDSLAGCAICRRREMRQPGRLPKKLQPVSARLGSLDASAFDIRPPCIYFLCRRGRVVYVGKTTSLAQRLAAHTRRGKVFDHVYYLPVAPFGRDNRLGDYALSCYEEAAIAALSPPENKTSHDPGRCIDDSPSFGAYMLGRLLTVGAQWWTGDPWTGSTVVDHA